MRDQWVAICVLTRPRSLFDAIEIVSVVVFTAEYVLRLWSCVEHMPYADRSPWAARLTWARTPAALVDLVAVLPFYLLVVAPVDLRAVALFRLVRFLKLARYSFSVVSRADAV